MRWPWAKSPPPPSPLAEEARAEREKLRLLLKVFVLPAGDPFGEPVEQRQAEARLDLERGEDGRWTASRG